MGPIVAAQEAFEDDVSRDELVVQVPPGAQLLHFADQEVFVDIFAKLEPKLTLCYLV